MSDNELLDELKQRIADDSVVFVVGSGVSVQATGNMPCASWTGLLRHAIDYARSLGLMTEPVANLTRQQIESGDLDLLLGAAQTVRVKLGNDFRAWLQDSVGKLTVKHAEVVDALHAVGMTLATTNYDHLLGGPAIPWTDAAAVEEVLRGRRKGVIHLHGDYEHPESVILDLRSYAQVVSSRHANAILSAVRTLKTLVFVGCGDGLADPHFDEFFRWTEDALADSPFRHFILCRAKDVDELRRKHPPERKLYPLPYGAGYEELSLFLRSLAPENEEPAPAKPSEVIPTLPHQGPCFGRKTEVAAIVEALLSAAPTRIAVLGTGGIGKTTVALAALRDLQVAARFGGRRFFVRCDAATNRDGLVSVIAAHLSITSGAQLSSAVLAALASGPSILVLDNFETPWQSSTIEVEEFLALLSGIDALQLIVTVRGIERPAGILWRDPIEPPRLPLSAAREAFLAIATRFSDDPNLDELLESMDRLPLAITLLAHLAQRETHLEPLINRWNEKRSDMLQRAA
ncbi:MAG TPA: SIR2 family protein, partial [Thermoanaerobaculia bacterium]|nr:SIR2 family protein [Thermoanaerobaculia bacterium]